MTSQGSAYARFRRALLTGNVTIIDAEAAELPVVKLDDALKVLVVYAEKRDPRYRRAAARFAARVAVEHRLGPSETRSVFALADSLPLAPEPASVLLREYLGPQA